MGPIGLRAQQSYHDTFCDQIVLEWKSPQFHGKNIVLVEGVCDRNLYSKFSTEETEVRETHGCRELPDVLKGVRDSIPVQSIAIKDSDFSRVNNSFISYPGLFYTDSHDCEMMMLSCGEVFDATVSEVGMEITEGFLAEVWQLLSPVSLLKWYCYSSNPQKRFSFRRVKVWAMNDDEALNISHLISIALETTKEGGREVEVDYSDIMGFVSSHAAYNNWEVVNGHDFIKMLSSRSKCNCSSKTFYKVLTKNYTLTHFKSTDLYNDIKQYESSISGQSIVSFFV